MQTASYGKRKLSLLGKILVIRHPDIAKELLTAIDPEAIEPIERDISKLPIYYQGFCDVLGINAEEYRGSLQNKAGWISVASSSVSRSTFTLPISTNNPLITSHQHQDLSFIFASCGKRY